MSALGQKRTCAMQNGMSALPPKATSSLWAFGARLLLGVSRPIFRPGSRRLTDTNRDDLRPPRFAPVVKPLALRFGRSPVVAEYVIEMLVVYCCIQKFLERRKLLVVPDKADAIERG